jgi:TolA-binding protein
MRNFFWLLLTTQLTSCVTLARFEELEGRVLAAERAAEAGDERDAKRFENLANLIKEASGRVDKVSASLNAELDASGDTARKLRGQFEEAQFQLAKLQREFDVVRGAAQTRWGLDFAPQVQNLPDDADGLLAYGKKQLESSQWATARAGYVRFLERFPTDERVPFANFGLARAYFGENQMKTAVKKFGEAYSAWQNLSASKAPPEAAESLWYAGLALETFDCKKGRDMLKFLRQTYPKSPRAAEAKTKLDGLKCK